MNFAYSHWIINPSTESIEFLKNQGVKNIETGPDFLLGYDEINIEKITNGFNKAGIRFYSTHAPFGGECDLSFLDNVRRTKAVSILKEFIVRAPIAKIKCLIIHPGDFLGNDSETKRLEKFQFSLETLLPIAEKNNLLLAVENMPPTSAGSSVSSIVSIVEKFNSPAMGICLDTGHLNITDEDTIGAFNRAKEKIIAFHFHDNDGARDIHLQPPYGTINWSELAAEILKCNYDFPALVEAQPWNNASPKQLLREVEAIFRGEFLAVEHNGQKANLVCDKCRHYLFSEEGNVFCGCGK